MCNASQPGGELQTNIGESRFVKSWKFRFPPNERNVAEAERIGDASLWHEIA